MLYQFKNVNYQSKEISHHNIQSETKSRKTSSATRHSIERLSFETTVDNYFFDKLYLNESS